MPRPRLEKNVGLPNRWRFLNGAYYYGVPPGLEHLWNFKQLFRLGDTIEAAWDEFTRMTEEILPGDDIEPSSMSGHKTVCDAAATIAKQGVYFLIATGEVVYVGRSDDVFSRISSHLARGIIQFDKIHTIAAAGLKQVRLEQLYIGRFRPTFNVYHKDLNHI